ncbi:hypothetical protein ACFY0A_46440 [Streptomyces sp. NPDC001698]|uniref:hypothetical protein n=1 Tax=unclassified Streptomyces TaxID=2593676 RepID=UPI0036794DA0
MTQHRRIELLQRVLTDETVQLRTRVAACLVLLYTQPLSRIIRLTIDDVLHDGQHVALRLGDPPTPIPEPLANLLLDCLAALPDNTPAANRGSAWLFPGRRAGQPMASGSLRHLAESHRHPSGHGRTAAIRQLAPQAPPPVVAQAPGYHNKTATRIATEAGAPWKSHAPGNHAR